MLILNPCSICYVVDQYEISVPRQKYCYLLKISVEWGLHLWCSWCCCLLTGPGGQRQSHAEYVQHVIGSDHLSLGLSEQDGSAGSLAAGLLDRCWGERAWTLHITDALGRRLIVMSCLVFVVLARSSRRTKPGSWRVSSCFVWVWTSSWLGLISLQGFEHLTQFKVWRGGRSQTKHDK